MCLGSKFTILKTKRVRFDCYQPSARGLLELVLRPNLSILAPDNLGTPSKARDELAENSRNFAFYESALLCKLDKSTYNSNPPIPNPIIRPRIYLGSNQN
jgi:hypothetical protein